PPAAHHRRSRPGASGAHGRAVPARRDRRAAAPWGHRTAHPAGDPRLHSARLTGFATHPTNLPKPTRAGETSRALVGSAGHAAGPGQRRSRLPSAKAALTATMPAHDTATPRMPGSVFRAAITVIGMPVPREMMLRAKRWLR